MKMKEKRKRERGTQVLRVQNVNKQVPINNDLKYEWIKCPSQKT